MQTLGTAILLTVFVFPSFAHAGKYNEKLSIGDKAPAWKDLLDAVSGKKHSLADFKDAEVVVVVFTCNSCPVATDYEDRILKLAEKYAVGPSQKIGNVALVAINVNKVKTDLPAAMKQRAEKKKYPFPYLFDETQQIARDYGALFTPEFFVLDRDRRVVYMGAMDDNSDAAKVTQNYLGPAVEAALAGKQPNTAETLPVGCRIRYALRR
jgi:peroxiredoxin